MANRFYIAYGSNLNVQQMAVRCPTATIVGTSVIHDYRLLFRGSRTGSYLTIEPWEGKKVPVAVWSVTEADVRRLDRYEGYPTFYYKEDMTLLVKSAETGKVAGMEGFAYLMYADRPLGRPSASYFSTCVHGYRSFGFDTKYLLDAFEASTKEDALWLASS